MLFCGFVIHHFQCLEIWCSTDKIKSFEFGTNNWLNKSFKYQLIIYTEQSYCIVSWKFFGAWQCE